MEFKKEYELAFPVDTVYRAWVSSETVIEPATAMDINPVVGGHYRLMMEMPDFTMKNEGTFSVVEPNEHINYSWEWNHDGEVTMIDVTFTSIPAGSRVTIHHTGFQKEESVSNHDSGWDNYMEHFIEYLKAI